MDDLAENNRLLLVLAKSLTEVGLHICGESVRIGDKVAYLYLHSSQWVRATVHCTWSLDGAFLVMVYWTDEDLRSKTFRAELASPDSFQQLMTGLKQIIAANGVGW